VRVSLFIPCFVDQLTPRVCLTTAKVLKRLGHEVAFRSAISFITGPSRTGHIERIPALGAHGPKEPYLVLVG
jgi:L-lactate utilization protein LutC